MPVRNKSTIAIEQQKQQHRQQKQRKSTASVAVPISSSYFSSSSGGGGSSSSSCSGSGSGNSMSVTDAVKSNDYGGGQIIAPTAATLPLTLNSLISCSLNGQLTPLTDLNFNAFINRHAAGENSNRFCGMPNGAGAAYSTSDNQSSSGSPSTNSSYGGDSNYSPFNVSSPPLIVNNGTTTTRTKSSASSSSSSTSCKNLNSAFDMANGNDFKTPLSASNKQEFVANGGTCTYDSMTMKLSSSATNCGIGFLPDDNDNFWDARMKDIADAMTYLELI